LESVDGATAASSSSPSAKLPSSRCTSPSDRAGDANGIDAAGDLRGEAKGGGVFGGALTLLPVGDARASCSLDADLAADDASAPGVGAGVPMGDPKPPPPAAAPAAGDLNGDDVLLLLSGVTARVDTVAAGDLRGEIPAGDLSALGGADAVAPAPAPTPGRGDRVRDMGDPGVAARLPYCFTRSFSCCSPTMSNSALAICMKRARTYRRITPCSMQSVSK